MKAEAYSRRIIGRQQPLLDAKCRAVPFTCTRSYTHFLALVVLSDVLSAPGLGLVCAGRFESVDYISDESHMWSLE